MKFLIIIATFVAFVNSAPRPGPGGPPPAVQAFLATFIQKNPEAQEIIKKCLSEPVPAGLTREDLIKFFIDCVNQVSVPVDPTEVSNAVASTKGTGPGVVGFEFPPPRPPQGGFGFPPPRPPQGGFGFPPPRPPQGGFRFPPPPPPNGGFGFPRPPPNRPFRPKPPCPNGGAPPPPPPPPPPAGNGTFTTPPSDTGPVASSAQPAQPATPSTVRALPLRRPPPPSQGTFWCPPPPLTMVNNELPPPPPPQGTPPSPPPAQ